MGTLSPDGDLAARLARIRAEIAAACARCGRRPEEVTLVGASKTKPATLLEEAWGAGLTVFGENRVQEALAKSAELPLAVREGIDWHLIGPLQSNKVRPALDLFSTLHALDRPEIALKVDHEAGARGRRLLGFLEVNLGEEESKHGFLPAGLAAAVAPLAGLAHLEIVGLMAIPPEAADAEGSRPWFRRLRELSEELTARPEWKDSFPGWRGWLSMGMSQDFAVAVEEGATHVRVGRALFGSRG